MKNYTLSLYLVLVGWIYLMPVSAFAQQYIQRSFGAVNLYDRSDGLYKTADGGFLIEGESNVVTDDDNTLVLKLDANANIEWAKVVGASDERSYYTHVRPLPEGGYVLAGPTPQSGWYVTKLNADFTIVWTLKYNKLDKLFGLLVDTDGNFMISGQLHAFEYGNSGAQQEFYLSKINANTGQVMWLKMYGNNSNPYDYGIAVAKTLDGGFLLNGRVGNIELFLALIKTDNNGVGQWGKYYSSSSYPINSQNTSIVHHCSDGGFLGMSSVVGPLGGKDITVFKLNSTGSILWRRSFGGNGEDTGGFVGEINGEYRIKGNTTIAGQSTPFIAALNPSTGTVTWARRLNSGSPHTAGLHLIENDGIYVAGATTFSDSSYDIYFAKMDLDLGTSDCQSITLQSTTFPMGLYSIALHEVDLTNQASVTLVTDFPLIRDVTSSIQEHNLPDFQASITANFTGDTLLCQGETLSLSAVEENAQYLWKKGNDTLGTARILTVSNIQESNFGVYTLEVSNASCSVKNTFNIAANCALPCDSLVHGLYQKISGLRNVNEMGEKIYKTKDGGFIVKGSSGYADYRDRGLLLVKLDSAGNTQWAKSYGTNQDIPSWVAHMQPLPSGQGFIIAEKFPSFAYVAKLDNQGNIVWIKDVKSQYHPSCGDYDGIFGLEVLEDDSFVISGPMHSFCAGLNRYLDGYITKFDKDGNVEWDKIYGDTGGIESGSITKTKDGSFVLCQSGPGIVSGGYGLYLNKVSSQGTLQWSKTYSVNGTLKLRDGVFATSDGGLLCSGYSSTGPYSGNNAVLMKLNALGEIEWARAYNNEGYGFGHVYEVNDGYYIREGFTKIDLQGNVVWSKRKTNEDGAIYTSSILIDGNYVYAVGSTDINNDTDQDFYFLKTNKCFDLDYCHEIEHLLPSTDFKSYITTTYPATQETNINHRISDATPNRLPIVDLTASFIGENTHTYPIIRDILSGFTGDTLLCQGESLFLTASDSTAGLQYLWKKGNDTLGTARILTVSNIQESNFGVYTLEVSNGFCSVKDTFEVAVKCNLCESPCQNQRDFQWAMLGAKAQGGGYINYDNKPSDKHEFVQIDTQGNIYVSGYFKGNAVFGNNTLTNFGDFDAYIAKYTSNQELVWVQHIGSSNLDDPAFIKLDKEGNIYFGGMVQGNTYFGKDTNGQDKYVNTGTVARGFFAKYNNNGQVLWVQLTGNYRTTDAFYLDEANGYIFVGGDSWGAENLGNGFSISKGYFAVYDINGNIVNAWSFGNSTFPLNINKDTEGNLYVVGASYAESFNIGSFNFRQTYGLGEIFIAKYAPGSQPYQVGEVLWAKSFGSLYRDYPYQSHITSNGDIFMTGSFEQTVDFGGKSVSSKGRYNMFAAAFDKDGNLKWLNSGLNTDHAYGFGVVYNAKRNIVYVTGNYKSPNITLSGGNNPDIVLPSKSSTGYPGSQYLWYDVFWAQYNAATGDLLKAERIGTPNQKFTSGYAMTLDKECNLYMTGGVRSGAGKFGNIQLPSTGNTSDMFIAKYGINQNQQANITVSAPTWCGADSLHINLSWCVAKPDTLYAQLSTINNPVFPATPRRVGQVSNQASSLPLTLPTELANGLYYVRLVDGENQVVSNVVSIRVSRLKNTFTGNVVLCPQDTLRLTSDEITAGVSYVWQKGGAVLTDTDGKANVLTLPRPIAGNDYTLTVITADSVCKVSKAFTVSISQPTAVTELYGDTILCVSEGSSAQGTYQASQTSGASRYRWEVRPGTILDATNPARDNNTPVSPIVSTDALVVFETTSRTLALNFDQTGVYPNAILVRGVGSCGAVGDSATLNLTLKTAPVVTLSASNQVTCDPQQATAQLTLQTGLTQPGTYELYKVGINAPLQTGSITPGQSSLLGTFAAGEYYVRVKEEGGCVSTSPTIRIEPSINPAIATNWFRISQSEFGGTKAEVMPNGDSYLFGTAPQYLTTETAYQLYGVQVTKKKARDLYVAKFDKAGHTAWVKPIHCDFCETGEMNTDAQGNVYVVFYNYQSLGRSEVLIPGDTTKYDATSLLAKFNADGVIQWVRKNPKLDNEELPVDPDGYTYGWGYDNTLKKYVVYRYALDGSRTNMIVGVQPKNRSLTPIRGGLYLVDAQDGSLKKYNNLGVLVWTRSISGGTIPADGYFEPWKYMDTDKEGNVYLTIVSEEGNTLMLPGGSMPGRSFVVQTSADVFVATYDPTGNLLNAFKVVNRRDFGHFDVSDNGKYLALGSITSYSENKYATVYDAQTAQVKDSLSLHGYLNLYRGESYSDMGVSDAGEVYVAAELEVYNTEPTQWNEEIISINGQFPTLVNQEYYPYAGYDFYHLGAHRYNFIYKKAGATSTPALQLVLDSLSSDNVCQGKEVQAWLTTQCISGQTFFLQLKAGNDTLTLGSSTGEGRLQINAFIPADLKPGTYPIWIRSSAGIVSNETQITITHNADFIANLGAIQGADVVCLHEDKTYMYALGIPSSESSSKYHWSLGNKTFVTTTPSFTYRFFGQYTAEQGPLTLKVYVQDSCGVSATVSKQITLLPGPPTRGMVEGGSFCEGQPFTLAVQGVNGASRYEWDFIHRPNSLQVTSHNGTIQNGVYTSSRPYISFTFANNDVADHTFYLRVRGVNACGMGVYSDSVAVTIKWVPDVTLHLNRGYTSCSDAQDASLLAATNAVRGIYTLQKLVGGVYQDYIDGLGRNFSQVSFDATTGKPFPTGFDKLGQGIYRIALTPPNGCIVYSTPQTIQDGSPNPVITCTSNQPCDTTWAGTIQLTMQYLGKPDNFNNSYTYTIARQADQQPILSGTFAHTNSTITLANIPGVEVGTNYELQVWANLKGDDPTCTTCSKTYCLVKRTFVFSRPSMTLAFENYNRKTWETQQRYAYYLCVAENGATVPASVSASVTDCSRDMKDYRVVLKDSTGHIHFNNTYSYQGKSIQQKLSFPDLKTGLYTLQLIAGSSNYGCLAEKTFEIIRLDSIQVRVETTPETCEKANDGTARAVITAAAGDIEYRWKYRTDSTAAWAELAGSYQSSYLTNLTPGLYRLEFRLLDYALECNDIFKEFVINKHKPAIDSLGLPNNTLANGKVGCQPSIQARLANPYLSGLYQFTWYHCASIGNACTDVGSFERIYTQGMESTQANSQHMLTSLLDPQFFTDSTYYYVTVTDPNGCVYTSEKALLTKPPVTRTYELCISWQTPAPTPKEKTQPSRTNPSIVASQAAYLLRNIANQCQIEKEQAIVQNLKESCLDPDKLEDTLTIACQQKQYHYTLYYYDRAGALTKTVPPEGVRTLSKADLGGKWQRIQGIRPAHKLTTTYTYNNLGQLISQHTPDGGESHFVYNTIGQLRYSQNARQKVEQVYSYTLYDHLGRVLEVGESKTPGPNFAFRLLQENDALANNPTFPDQLQDNGQQTHTVYSQQAPVEKGVWYCSPDQSQRYLQNRVSYTYTYNKDQKEYGVYTYYSYDPHGNVEWIVQDIPGIGRATVGYEYDLISGKVLKVRYNECRADQFYHRYEYDEDNRLTAVYTSRDNHLWDRDAHYQYYAHGPMQRTEIGEDNIQGLDYVYTIHGWLKGINGSNAKTDIGQDGQSVQSRFAADEWGMTLGYYQGDYHNRTGTLRSVFESSAANSHHLQPNHDLYNGNISTWASHMNQQNPTASTYQYDILNRIKSSERQVWNQTSWRADANVYRTAYSYDGNGNIETLTRYDEKGSKMDELKYIYENELNGEKLTNKLRKVQEQAAATTYEKDIENTSFETEYVYDAIGNLIEDRRDSIAVEWNVYGKVSKVKPLYGAKKPIIRYLYDAAGNRVAKEVDKGVSEYTTPDSIRTTYYIRDAQGNILSTYERRNKRTTENADLYTAQYRQQEVMLYGSDRLGLYQTDSLINEQPFLKEAFHQPGIRFFKETHVQAENTSPLVNFSLYTGGMPTAKESGISIAETSTGLVDMYGVVAQNYWGKTHVVLFYDRNKELWLDPDTTQILAEAQNQSLFVRTDSSKTAREYAYFTVHKGSIYQHRIKVDDVTGIEILEKNTHVASGDSLHPYGGHLAAQFDVLRQKLYLYGTHYQASTRTHALQVWVLEKGQVTQTTTMATQTHLAQPGGGEIQLSPDGQQLFWYQLGNRKGFFSAREAKPMVYQLNPDGVSVAGSFPLPVPPDHSTYHASLDVSPASLIFYTQDGLTQTAIHQADAHTLTLTGKTDIQASGDIRRTRYNQVVAVAGDSLITWNADLQKSKSPLQGFIGNALPVQVRYFKEKEMLPDSGTYARQIRRKQYELKDHLENVRVVVSDGKLVLYDGTDSLNIRGLKAEVLSYNNYYPFGMELPGGTFQSESYRFGFNGKEKDNNINEGDYDFGARIYNSKLGKWLSTDPLQKKYPSLSPYLMTNNNPVIYKDIDGRDFVIVIDKQNKKITIQATYYTDIKESTQVNVSNILDHINARSEKYKFASSDGIDYDIYFELKLGKNQGTNFDNSMKAVNNDESNHVSTISSFPLNVSLGGNNAYFWGVFGITNLGGDNVEVSDPDIASDELMKRYGVEGDAKSFMLKVLLHEILHTLGVAHPAMPTDPNEKPEIDEKVIEGILSHASDQSKDFKIVVYPSLSKDKLNKKIEQRVVKKGKRYSNYSQSTFPLNTEDQPKSKIQGGDKNILKGKIIKND